MYGPTSRNFISQRIHLHYADWGNPEAPLLILVHGVLDHCRSWDWVAQELQGDFHVVAPDLRGHGDSDHAPAGIYSTAIYLADLAQLIRQSGRGRVSLIGHGLGGGLALAYAAVYPDQVKQVVAIEGLGDLPATRAARSRAPIAQRLGAWIKERQGIAGRTPKRYATIQEAYARMRWQNPNLTPQQALHLTEHGVDRNEDGTFSWKFDNYVRAPGDPRDLTDAFARLWPNITCPVLLVFGEETGSAQAYGPAELEPLGTAAVQVIAAAGHWPHHDQLDAFLGIVRGFTGEGQLPAAPSLRKARPQ
jgi:pimeloyl-ACP methyl ester carboxylesterase